MNCKYCKSFDGRECEKWNEPLECKEFEVDLVYIQPCPYCEEEFPTYDLVWVYDSYGIPYKKVCQNCHDEVKKYIEKWKYDYLDAGEYLD